MATHGIGRIHPGLLILSLSAGAADPFAFLALGGVFTANMTGNLILIGMFTRPEFVETLLAAALAIASFVGVLYAAFRLTAPPSTPIETRARAVRRLLLPSLVLQLGVVGVWAALPDSGGFVARCVMIVLAAASLALQTVAAKKLSDVDGVTTTYVTGTLTTTMQELALGSGRGQGIRVLSVIALPVGAVAGTAVLMWFPPIGPALPLVTATVATAVLWADVRRRPMDETAGDPAPTGKPGIGSARVERRLRASRGGGIPPRLRG